MTEILERLEIDYLLGGSLASSFLGEPRSTIDIDLALRLEMQRVESLISALEPAFYVDLAAARAAVARHASFNAIHRETMLKVDFFTLADSPFDREQVRRRQRVSPGEDTGRDVAVSSAEDLVLRKLAGYRLGGGVSDRQWRDVLGVVKVQGERIELAYLRRWAGELGLSDLVERALADARP
jgi:hypothetical protein